MPVKSKSQFKFIQMMRSKHPNAKKEWYWKSDWIGGVDYDKLPEEQKLKRYKPHLSEITTMGSIVKSDQRGDLNVPETPIKKWQAPIPDEEKERHGGEIKIVKPQGE